jgi:hypothetical protein
MDHPTSRAELKTLAKTDDELIKEQVNNRIQEVMTTIVNEILLLAKLGHTYFKYDLTKKENSLKVEFIKKVVRIEKNGSYSILTKYPGQPITNITPTILEMLKVRFPDCTIMIDPFNTYIFVEWS